MKPAQFFIITLCFFNSLISTNSFAAPCNMPKETQSELDQSVFQIIPINAYAGHMSVERAREIYQRDCLIPSPLLHERLNCEVLKTCTGEKTCVKEHSAHGTAFLYQEKLVTAWHVTFSTHGSALLFLQNALTKLELPELKQKLKVLKPAFVLFNSKADKVFDTREADNAHETTYAEMGDPLSPIYSQNGTKHNRPYGHYENIPGDFVSINLPHKIGPSLKASTRQTKCLYSIGFAFNGEATRFKYSGGEASSIKERQKLLKHLIPFQRTPLDMGQQEFLSLSEEESLLVMGFSAQESSEQLEKYGREKVRQSINVVYRSHQRNMRDQRLDNNDHILVHTGAVLPGQSGGPLVTQNGELIGITTNGFINSLGAIKESVGGAGLKITDIPL